MGLGNEPVTTEAFFDIPFPREAVWPVLSNTDWLNRSAGLPPVSYEINPLVEGGTSVIASTRFYGLPLRWEEKPFEWSEPEFYRVERVFGRGPLDRMMGSMEFREAAGKTRLRISSEIHPRNRLGAALARFILGPAALSGMQRMIQHVTAFLQGAQLRPLPKLPQTEVNERSMSATLRQLRDDPGFDQPALVDRLEKHVRESADVELARIRPFALARQWKEDRWQVLKLLLRATRAGLLDFSWEVLCPNCRSSRHPVRDALADVRAEAHCEVCQIQFNAEFDRSVELKFTVNANVKTCDEKTFCLAGPGARPHVVAQFRLPPNQTRTIRLASSENGLRIRSPQVRYALEAGRLEGKGRLVCHKEGFAPAAIHASHDAWELYNPNPYPVVVMFERSQWSEDILTAACATNLQDFRDLFARQVISPSEKIVVGQQIVLFTDLRGSTALYCGIGDAPAYALVRDHFQILRRVMDEHRGGIVKTIGDAVMGTFSDPLAALQAVRKMHLELARLPNADPVLLLKSSLHIGPCLAVNANDRLDYFGTTVNLAARLVSCCRGGDLTISDDFFRRTEVQAFLQDQGLRAESSEMRFRGFDSPAKVWRIDLLNAAS